MAKLKCSCQTQPKRGRAKTVNVKKMLKWKCEDKNGKTMDGAVRNTGKVKMGNVRKAFKRTFGAKNRKMMESNGRGRGGRGGCGGGGRGGHGGGGRSGQSGNYRGGQSTNQPPHPEATLQGLERNFDVDCSFKDPYLERDSLKMKTLLDNCQGQTSFNNKGHVRNHTYRSPGGVAEYSKTDRVGGKSGFFTEKDQDKAVLRAVYGANWRRQADKLRENKNGSFCPNEIVNYHHNPRCGDPDGPICGHWYEGELKEIFLSTGTSFRFTGIDEQLRRKKRELDNYGMFVVTAYPLGSDLACYKLVKGGADENGEGYERVYGPNIYDENGNIIRDQPRGNEGTRGRRGGR